MADSRTLVLIPGLAASQEIFTPQRLAFLELVVPEWPQPRWDETLNDYARRIADSLPAGPNLVLGGASFGGIVAMHVAQFVPSKAVILIGSLRDPQGLPWIATVGRRVPFLVPFLPIRPVQFLVRLFSTPLNFCMPSKREIFRQFCLADPHLVKWSLLQLLYWKSSPPVDCPVYHIHGRRDWLLQPRNSPVDNWIEGAGHVISLTHGKEVNEFIGSIMQRVSEGGLT